MCSTSQQRRDYGLCSKIHSYFIFELRRSFLFASFLVLGAFRSPVGRSYRLATFCELVLRELALRTHLTKCTQAIFHHTPPLRNIASSIFVRGRSFASPSPSPPWIVKTSFILFALRYDHSLPLPGAGNTTEARRPAVSLSMSTQMGSHRKFVFRPNLFSSPFFTFSEFSTACFWHPFAFATVRTFTGACLSLLPGLVPLLFRSPPQFARWPLRWVRHLLHDQLDQFRRHHHHFQYHLEATGIL
jgi:hypothetical protein